MISPKDELVRLLMNPNSFENAPDFLARKIEGLVPISEPTTKDGAIIAIGKFHANANKFLLAFEDVPLLDFLLRGGARNEALIGLLLASLELAAPFSQAEEDERGDFAVILPEGGRVYYTGQISFLIRIDPDFADQCVGVAVSTDSGSIALTRDGVYWGGEITISEPGDISCTITADFGTYQKSKSSSVAVESGG